MTWVRTWLPLAMCLSGVVVLVLRDFDETGWEAITLLVAAGSSVWLLNVLFRLGVRGDVERDAEAAAREFFDAHGHWPDEQPPRAGGPGSPQGRRVPPHGHEQRPRRR